MNSFKCVCCKDTFAESMASICEIDICIPCSDEEEVQMTAVLRFDPFTLSAIEGMPWVIDIYEDEDFIDIERFTTKEDAVVFCKRWDYDLQTVSN